MLDFPYPMLWGLRIQVRQATLAIIDQYLAFGSMTGDGVRSTIHGRRCSSRIALSVYIYRADRHSAVTERPISATVAPIGVKFYKSLFHHTILHDGTGLTPFGGGAPGYPQIRNFGPEFWPFDREYLENTQLYSPFEKAAQLYAKK